MPCRIGARLEITFKVAEYITGKVQGNTFLAPFAATWLIIENVVPAVLVIGVAHQRCAHDKDNLTSGHAGFQLVDHLLGDDITLRNRDFIDSGELGDWNR